MYILISPLTIFDRGNPVARLAPSNYSLILTGVIAIMPFICKLLTLIY